MLCRYFVHHKPKKYPDKTNSTGENKSPFPTHIYCNPGHCQGSDNRADVRTGIKNSCSKSSFFFGEPFCNCLYCCRKITSFTYSQGCPCNTKTKCTICQCMTYRCKAPDQCRKRISNFSTYFVYKSANR